MAFTGKISQMLGMNTEEDYYEDDKAFEEEAEEKTSNSEISQPNDDSNLISGANVFVLDPEVFEDTPIIVNKIKENKTVVVNLKNTEYEEGRKIFDFLNGAVFALEGSITKISDSVFILAPNAVSVSTKVEKSSDDVITSFLDWDEK